MNTCKESVIRKTQAFTLIELLVVISIIALLVAILIPVLSNVMYAARTTQCTSNLHQVAVGITAYTVDNDSRYPHNVGPIRDRYLNALDGEYYRWERKPWSIRSSGRWDYVEMVENYFSDLNEVFVCPHVGADWDTDVYSQQTNATVIPYAFYWGISDTGNPAGVRVPLTQYGEGWGPGTKTDGGGITQSSRYTVIASDYMRYRGESGGLQYIQGRHLEGNHPPAAGNYEFFELSNGQGSGYAYAETTAGNANYAYEDGSVEMYGRIYKSNIGDNAENEFRDAGAWLVPTDRVD